MNSRHSSGFVQACKAHAWEPLFQQHHVEASWQIGPQTIWQSDKDQLLHVHSPEQRSGADAGVQLCMFNTSDNNHISEGRTARGPGRRPRCSTLECSSIFSANWSHVLPIYIMFAAFSERTPEHGQEQRPGAPRWSAAPHFLHAKRPPGHRPPRRPAKCIILLCPAQLIVFNLHLGISTGRINAAETLQLAA